MRRFFAGLLLLVLAGPVLNVAAKPAPVDGPESDVQVNAIINAFTAKETEFRQALNNYEFERDALIQTIGAGGEVTGEYHRVSRFTFDDSGKRYERITYFPPPTLTEISVTPEDLEDLGGIQPFALEASKLNQYIFNYVGREHIDELDLYVFDVAPKVMPNPKKSSERFFQGRIWVDTRDSQIVMVRGIGVPEGNQRFPHFETRREQIDGRYWFPTYTSADDNLQFPNGQVVHIKMLVRYTNFKRFGSKVIIKDVEGDVVPDEKPAPAPSPSPAKKP